MSRILPPTGGLAQPYFEGCSQGVLRLQRCQSCSHIQFYPRIACTACDGRLLEWVTASGKGVVASFTVVEHAVSSGYDTPYVVALIDLEEGPRMMSHLVGFDQDELVVGARVSLSMAAWSDDISLPVFRPAVAEIKKEEAVQ